MVHGLYTMINDQMMMCCLCVVLSTLLAVRCVVRCCALLLCIASAVSRDSRPARGPGEGGGGRKGEKGERPPQAKKMEFCVLWGPVNRIKLAVNSKTSFKTVA